MSSIVPALNESNRLESMARFYFLIAAVLIVFATLCVIGGSVGLPIAHLSNLGWISVPYAIAWLWMVRRQHRQSAK